MNFANASITCKPVPSYSPTVVNVILRMSCFYLENVG